MKKIILCLLVSFWSISVISAEDNNEWKVASGEIDGHKILYRYRVNLLGNVETNKFPTMIAIKWNYDEKNEFGFPSGETNSQQLRFEELLDPLDSSEFSYLTEVVTRNGTKEWIWYVESFESWMERFNSVLKAEPAYPIEINYYDEPNWETYTGFINWISSE